MGWWKYAKPGDEVVCLKKGAWSFSKPNELVPVFGEVVIIERFKEVEGEIFLRLIGYRSGVFLASRFKPLQKSKTDISVFTSMLTKTRKQNVRELEGVQ